MVGSGRRGTSRSFSESPLSGHPFSSLETTRLGDLGLGRRGKKYRGITLPYYCDWTDGVLHFTQFPLYDTILTFWEEFTLRKFPHHRKRPYKLQVYSPFRS